MEQYEFEDEKNDLTNREGNTIPDYVLDLYQKLLEQQEERGFVFAKIIGSTKYGFKIKSNGLFGTLPIKMMPWRYGMWKVWDLLKESFNGVILPCKVLEVEPFNKYLYFDAIETKFPGILLEKGQEVKAIVVQSRKSGFVFEFGHNFKWKYGSLIGRIHKKDYPANSVWGEKSIGTEHTMYYHYTTQKGQIQFLASPFKEIKLTKESILWHKHGVQPITVRYNEQGKRTYWVNNTFPALIYKRNYKKRKIPTAEQTAFLNSLKDGDIFDCRTIDITKAKSHFIVVLTFGF